MKQLILSKLLHYANRTRFDKRWVRFYDIKNTLLKKYGKFERYDLQFIEGKRCYSCGGTGIYVDWYGNKDGCYNCYSGWYKRPFLSLLEVVRFGKHTFHQPKERLYAKPDGLEVNIQGYISHSEPKYGFLAMMLLLFIYDRKSMKYYFRFELSNGWRLEWWKPYNFILNSFHLVKRRHKAIPIVRLREKLEKILKPKPKKYIFTPSSLDDDLPF